jgi:hypothetical protein
LQASSHFSTGTRIQRTHRADRCNALPVQCRCLRWRTQGPRATRGPRRNDRVETAERAAGPVCAARISWLSQMEQTRSRAADSLPIMSEQSRRRWYDAIRIWLTGSTPYRFAGCHTRRWWRTAEISSHLG